MADHFRNPLPPLKKENKNFIRAFKAGTLPSGNKAVKTLLKYTGKRGKPNLRALRSKKAREEYNKALTEYNRTRPTAKKEAERREKIREKQRKSIHRNIVDREAAEREVERHDKLVDILTDVHDRITQLIRYEEAMELIQENPDMTAEDIVKFIMDQYQVSQNELPTFARKGADVDEGALSEALLNTIEEVGTYNIDVLTLALESKSTPAQYSNFLAVTKKIGAFDAEDIKRGMTLRAGGRRGAYPNFVKSTKTKYRKAKLI